MPHRLLPYRVHVRSRGDRGASHHRSGEGEAEPRYGGASRGGVGVPEPQDAGADQVTQPAAQGGGVDRQGQAGQPERRYDRSMITASSSPN